MGESALKHGAARRRGSCRHALAPGVTVAALAHFAGAAFGADAPPPPARDFTTYMPTAKATRIDAAEAPTIDGDLSDPVWQKAQAITEFYQVEPNEGQAPSERTDVRFLYDANNLYVYVY